MAFTLFTFVGYTWSTGLVPQRRDGGQSRYRSKGSSAHRREFERFQDLPTCSASHVVVAQSRGSETSRTETLSQSAWCQDECVNFHRTVGPCTVDRDGPAKLLAELENGRFQRTGFQEMPRAYETFYEKTVFQRGGLEPMAMYLTAIEVAKRDLEAVDTKTKISQNELGYHALKNSGLSREEQRMVLSRADETYDFAKISQTLKNLFPCGTHTGRQTGQHQTRHQQRRAPP